MFKSILRNFLEDLGLVESQEYLEWLKWYNGQINKLNDKEEIQPPWIVYPKSSPVYGWNQGYQEAWLKNVWLPFWQSLSPILRQTYLDKWKPPNKDWREYLTVHWLKS